MVRGLLWKLAYLPALGAVLALAACGGDGGEGEDRPTVDILGGAGSVSISGVVEGYGEELYMPSTDQAMNLAIGADLRDIRSLMSGANSGNPVDWAQVSNLYTAGKNQVQPDGMLRSLASIAAEDYLAFPNAAGVYGSPAFIDAIIRDAIAGSGRSAGLSDNSRRQIIDKTIQTIMYGRSLQGLSVARDRFSGANGLIDEAWATLAGVRDLSGTPNNGLLATGLGREEDFMLQGRLSRPLESSLYRALTSIELGDRESFTRAVDASRDYINTIMYLSTLRYAKVLEADMRTADRETHLAEAWAFFQSIRAQVAAASPAAADTVESAYSRSAEEPFTGELTTQVYAAMNQPAVLEALGIPDEFQFKSPSR